jgi:hypothetical protein
MATLSGLFRQLIARRHAEADLPAIGRLIESGKLDEAEARLAVLGGRANDRHARLLMARLARERGDVDGARAILEEAIARDGEMEDARLELAALARAAGDGEAERKHYETFLRAEPDAPRVLNNLGLCLITLGDPDAAVPVLQRALAVTPTLQTVRVNLARALLECGRYREALEHERAVLDASPGSPGARLRLAHLQLLTGDLEAGWQGYELRRNHPDFPRPELPAWQGGDPRGRRLLVFGEQGLGDAILFIRFLPVLVERGAQVIYKARRPLARLFQSSFSRLPVEIRAELGDFALETEAFAPLVSLPHLLSLGAEAVRRVPPYLRPDAALAEHWRARIHARPGLRVGLVWAGNPERRGDESRSLAPRVVAPLAAARPDVSWFSLQWPSGELPFPMDDPMGGITDYADTAAIIAALDLVISVDTSVAHCAAALGKPVWLLAPRAPCWRWIVGDRESPWYDGVRLFRPVRSGEWSPVIDAVARELARYAPH